LALRFNRTGVPNATGPLSVTTQTRSQHQDLPEVTPAVPWTPSAPDTTGPSNRAGQPSRLGPVTGGVRSTVSATLGMGLAIRVTLRAADASSGATRPSPWPFVLRGRSDHWSHCLANTTRSNRPKLYCQHISQGLTLNEQGTSHLRPLCPDTALVALALTTSLPARP